MIDMSMERIRTVIDRACQDGKCYAAIEKAAAPGQSFDDMGNAAEDEEIPF